MQGCEITVHATSTRPVQTTRDLAKVNSPSEYGRSGPCLGVAWADTDDPVYQVEINEVNDGLAEGDATFAVSVSVSPCLPCPDSEGVNRSFDFRGHVPPSMG